MKHTLNKGSFSQVLYFKGLNLNKDKEFHLESGFIQHCLTFVVDFLPLYIYCILLDSIYHCLPMQKHKL